MSWLGLGARAHDRAKAEAKLHEHEQRLAAELSGSRLLQRLSTRLIPEQAPEALYEQILDTAMELMGADAVSIQLLEEDGKRLRRVATRNLHPDSTEYWTWVDASHASTCGQALAKDERVMVEDVEASPELAGTGDLAAFRASGTRAVQSTPLLTRTGRPIGMISTHWRAPRRFDESDFDLFDILARQVADLFERSRAEAALRGSEERQAFLLRLGDAMREQSSAETKIETAARLLGEHLAASRVLWAEYDWDQNVAHIFNGWFADGALPFPTVMQLADYDGEVLSDLRAGKTVRVDNVGLLTDEAAYAAIAEVGVQALLSPPLLVDGTLKVNLSIHQHEPRHWTDDEVALVQEVAERLWAEVVRARAEAALAESEEKYRTIFGSIDEGFALIEVIVDDEGKPVDLLHLETNSAYERHTGLRNVGGKRALEIAPDFDPMWFDFYDKVARTGDAARAESHMPWIDRWITLHASRVGGAGSRKIAVVFNDITERKRAEAALRDSEERQRLTLELVPVLLWSASPDGRHVSLNERWLTYTGQDESDTQNYGWLDAIHPDDLPKTRAAFEHAFATGEPLERQHRIHKANDGYRWHLVRHVPLRDAQGAITRWFGAAVDIHESKLAEQTLQQSEERQAFLLKLSDAIRPLTDAAEIQAATSRLVSEHLGTDRAMYAEVQGVRGSDTRTIHGQYVRPSGEGEAAIAPFPERFVFSDYGEQRMAARYRGAPLVVADIDADADASEAERASWRAAGVRAAVVAPLVKDGRLVAEFGVHCTSPRAWTDAEVSLIRDVAERTWVMVERARAEADRHESEERLRRFGEASQDVLWIREAETLRWTYLTPAFETIYGMTREAALTGDNFRNWVHLIVPEDRDSAVAAIERVRAGEWVTFEYRIRRPSDGSICWLRNTDFPIVDAKGSVSSIGGIGHDITREREMADRQQVMVAELQHRTRNLITVVRALSKQTLAGSASLDEFEQRFNHRLAALSRVQGLLSHLSAGKRVSFDELLHSELSALGAPDNKVTLDGPAGVPLRSATVQTFALALHELATNALKYGALIASEGHLAVRWSVSNAEAGEPRLHVDWRESGVAMTHVKDRANGGGYGRELIERALPYQLDAETSYEMTDDGVHCTVEVPISTTYSEAELRVEHAT